jgi:hypothetical protein
METAVGSLIAITLLAAALVRLRWLFGAPPDSEVVVALPVQN